jgi:hypothetical protein
VSTKGCQLQRLSLVAADADAEEWGTSGTLWFDDLQIRHIE